MPRIQDFVIRIGIERRVEINEVNARFGKKLRVAQPLEIVAEQEAVHTSSSRAKVFRLNSKSGTRICGRSGNSS